MALSPRLFASGFCILLGSLAHAADWPQWRGPKRDGVAEGVVLPSRWPDSLKRAWSVSVGEGHSGPVVMGDRVFQFARVGDDEVLHCFDLNDGKLLWKEVYAAPYELNDAARAHGKGPKSTPVYADGRIVTLGISGILKCRDAATGRLHWQHEFHKEFKSTSPLYGTAMSPLVVDGLLIAHVGGHDRGRLAAFDMKTGEEKWKASDDGPGYASPIVAQLGGRQQIITQTQIALLAIDPSDGKTLWKVPFKTEYDQNSVTPVAFDNHVIYSGYSQPLVSLRVEKQTGGEFTTKEAWSNKSFPLYMSTPVLAGNRLIGFSQKRSGQPFCVDARNGKTLWESDGRGGENASIIRIGNTILMLTSDRNFMVLDANAERFEPKREYKISDSPTWAHPAPVEKGLLVKDKTALTYWKWFD